MSWQCKWGIPADLGSGLGDDYMDDTQSLVPQNREQHMQKLEIWLCQICNKEFVTKSGLSRHLTTAHKIPKTPKLKAIKDMPRAKAPPREKAQSAVCGVCHKTLTSQGRLIRHINTVHQRAPQAQAQGTTVTKNIKVVQMTQTNVTVNLATPPTVHQNQLYGISGNAAPSLHIA